MHAGMEMNLERDSGGNLTALELQATDNYGDALLFDLSLALLPQNKREGINNIQLQYGMLRIEGRSSLANLTASIRVTESLERRELAELLLLGNINKTDGKLRISR